MLRSVLVLVSLLAAAPALAQVPERMPIQGSLFDAEGLPVDGVVPMDFAVYGDAAGTVLLHRETVDVDVVDGFFTVYLGGGSASLDVSAFADHSTAFLGVAVDGEPEMDLLEIATVPYSAYADVAGDAATLGGTGPEEFVREGTIEWTDIGSRPAGIESDADTLAGLSCADGEVARFDGTAWTCAADADGLAGLTCTDGSVLKWVNGATGGWACATDTDTDTRYGALTGLQMVQQDSPCVRPPLGRGLCPGPNFALDVAFTDARYVQAPLTGADIPDNSITSFKIIDGHVTTNDLKDGQVFTADIADGTVTSADIALNTITSGDIQDGGIGSVDILNGTITHFDIASGTITGGDIDADAVGSVHIANGAVTGADIKDATIGSIDIADGHIAGVDIADGTITGGQIADGTIQGVDIDNHTITGAHIANGTITAADIDVPDPAVDTSPNCGNYVPLVICVVGQDTNLPACNQVNPGGICEYNDGIHCAGLNSNLNNCGSQDMYLRVQ